MAEARAGGGGGSGSGFGQDAGAGRRTDGAAKPTRPTMRWTRNTYGDYRFLNLSVSIVNMQIARDNFGRMYLGLGPGVGKNIQLPLPVGVGIGQGSFEDLTGSEPAYKQEVEGLMTGFSAGFTFVVLLQSVGNNWSYTIAEDPITHRRGIVSYRAIERGAASALIGMGAAATYTVRLPWFGDP